MNSCTSGYLRGHFLSPEWPPGMGRSSTAFTPQGPGSHGCLGSRAEFPDEIGCGHLGFNSAALISGSYFLS